MKSIEGENLPEKLSALLGRGEQARFAARPDYATVSPGSPWTGAVLILTNQRLVLSKDRMFGKPKADFHIAWSDIDHVEGGVWNGGGPKIQLRVHTSRSATPIELIVRPEFAADVESAIRSGYMNR